MAHIHAIEFVTGSQKITNDDLKSEFPDYNYSKFERKVGIYSRNVLSDNETSLDLAITAVFNLIKKNNIEKNQINFIIHCTQSPEYMLPTSACIIQDRCKLDEDTGAFDINLGCSGYTYGLLIAKSLIESGSAQNIILVTSDSYTRYIHPKDLINRLIFGDAATATLITANGSNSLEKFKCGSSGSGWNKLLVKNNFFNVRKEKVERKIYGNGNVYTDNHLYMDGPAIFDFTINKVPPLINQILSLNNLKAHEIDQFIPHQANAFLLKSISTLANIEQDKLFLNLTSYGNTVSSTIPIALKEYSEQCDYSKNKKILLAGFGVGLSWSAGVLNLQTTL